MRGMTNSKSVEVWQRMLKQQNRSPQIPLKWKETKDGKILKDNNEMTELVTSYFGSVFSHKIL